MTFAGAISLHREVKKIFPVLTAALFAFTAHANTVFDTFGPGDTSGGGGLSVGNFVEQAAQFTAGTSGDLATVDLGLTYFDGFAALPVTSISMATPAAHRIMPIKSSSARELLPLFLAPQTTVS